MISVDMGDNEKWKEGEERGLQLIDSTDLVKSIKEIDIFNLFEVKVLTKGV